MRYDPGLAASAKCEIKFEVERGKRLCVAVTDVCPSGDTPLVLDSDNSWQVF
jgi:hypothetical protein